MRYVAGHLGITVSALLDGELDRASAERAWAHVQGCEVCSREVEHEGWVKTRLAMISADGAPPADLLGSLYVLGVRTSAEHPADDAAAAWAAVEDLERRGRVRRRTGIALAGAGSVSVAVLGLASLGGATLGIGGGAPSPPQSTLSRAPSPGPPSVTAPVARLHGRVLPEVEPSIQGTGAASDQRLSDAARAGLMP